MRVIKYGTICLIFMGMTFLAVGCGGCNMSTPTTLQGKLVDPSGNWKQSFTDASGNTFILSALYNQVGAVVTALNVSETGNGAGATPPTPFACAVQPNVAM